MAVSRNHLLAALSLLLLGIAGFMAVDFSRSGVEEAVRQANAVQVLLALQASRSAASHLRESSRDLRNLARLASIRNGDRAQIDLDIQEYYNAAHPRHRPPISVLDQDGGMVFSSQGATPPPYLATPDFLRWVTNRENQDKVLIAYEPGVPEEAAGSAVGTGLVMATPLLRETPDPAGTGGALGWRGALLVSLDLEATLTQPLSVLSAQPRPPRVWVMDQDGTILLHSEHPEMKRENVHRVASRCLQCHVSFDYAKRMLAVRTGTARYQLKGKGEKEKLAAFVPMRFANASWTVVVNAPLAEVTDFVRSSYIRILLPLGLIVAALGLVSLIAHRSNLSRVRAEAEARQWQEKHRLEGEIRRAEEQYHTLYEQSPDGILMVDPETMEPIDFNDAAHRQLGYSRDEFARLRLLDYEVPATSDASRARLERVLREGRAGFETQFRRKDGEIRHVEVHAQILDLAERKVLHCLYHDITKRKEIELALARRAEQVRQEAAIKTTLLHDVNHRVKNNLLRMMEIVRLQDALAPASEAGLHLVLGDLESRLHGMAVVHTMLSGTQWRPLPLDDLVRSILTATLSGSPIRERIGVTVLAPREPLFVVPEQATAIALVVNELGTNSVKHAFANRLHGRLHARLSVEDNDDGRVQVRLDYRDDGPGWPEPILNGEGGRVGLRLIRASVRSPLRGELTLRNDAGAVATLAFRLALPA